MRFSSILVHLRCWFGRHSWVTVSGLTCGKYTVIRACTDCGTLEYAA